MTEIHVIRHAKAKNRFEWTEPDERRPLTKRGRREAETIARRLADEPLARLVSSPYRRCLQTLEPLASALEVSVETTSLLAEGADGVRALDELVGLADEPLACCTHGDVLFEIAEAIARLGVPLDGPSDVPVAAAWVLTVDSGSVVAARFVEQPPRDHRD